MLSGHWKASIPDELTDFAPERYRAAGDLSLKHQDKSDWIPRPGVGSSDATFARKAAGVRGYVTYGSVKGVGGATAPAKCLGSQIRDSRDARQGGA
jgi:hypothetical protein